MSRISSCIRTLNVLRQLPQAFGKCAESSVSGPCMAYCNTLWHRRIKSCVKYYIEILILSDMKLETSCVPIVFPVRNFPRGKPRAFVRGIRILWSPLDRYHVCIRCKSTSIEEPGRKDESLLDNIEITRE